MNEIERFNEALKAKRREWGVNGCIPDDRAPQQRQRPGHRPAGAIRVRWAGKGGRS